MSRKSWAALALALLAPPSWPAAPASDPAMAERLAACAACHGKEGRSQAGQYFPSIAGKPAGYLANQLFNFRDGRRHHAIMERMFAFLSDDYLQAMADYYAAQAPAIAPPLAGVPADVLERGRQLVEHGDSERDLPACRECHGEMLTGAQPSIPGLTGLPLDYLNAQLGAWREGVRKAREPDCMAGVAKKLTPAEIQAVTSWIASQPVVADHRPLPRPPERLPIECGSVP